VLCAHSPQVTGNIYLEGKSNENKTNNVIITKNEFIYYMQQWMKINIYNDRTEIVSTKERERLRNCNCVHYLKLFDIKADFWVRTGVGYQKAA